MVARKLVKLSFCLSAIRLTGKWFWREEDLRNQDVRPSDLCLFVCQLWAAHNERMFAAFMSSVCRVGDQLANETTLRRRPLSQIWALRLSFSLSLPNSLVRLSTRWDAPEINRILQSLLSLTSIHWYRANRLSPAPLDDATSRNFLQLKPTLQPKMSSEACEQRKGKR